MPVDEAEMLLAVAGLVVTIEESGRPIEDGAIRTVAGQSPAHGVLLQSGGAITLFAPPQGSASKERVSGDWLVCIDPGHQARSDLSPEPIGPDAKTMKQRVTAGVTGAETGMPESEITLQVAVNLKKRLESLGLRVVMTRTTNDVNISNRERALVANRSGAHLFVRIQGQGSTDPATAGVEVLYPGMNRWTAPIASSSKQAAHAVHSAVLQATGAPDQGVLARTDLTGFNWSKTPAILVGCGYLTNPVEDRLLASPHYQDKLAGGIADGIVAYLEREGD
jgi:N-acetylmuramoyl-L-alanine amidase